MNRPLGHDIRMLIPSTTSHSHLRIAAHEKLGSNMTLKEPHRFRPQHPGPPNLSHQGHPLEVTLATYCPPPHIKCGISDGPPTVCRHNDNDLTLLRCETVLLLLSLEPRAGHVVVSNKVKDPRFATPRTHAYSQGAPAS